MVAFRPRSQAAFFNINCTCNICEVPVLSQLNKIKATILRTFTIFFIVIADSARLRGHRMLERVLSQLPFMMEKPRYREKPRRFDNIVKIIQPRSLAQIICSQSEKGVNYVIFMALIFSYCESTCGLTDFPASMYDRKIPARSFDTIHDILRSFSLAQSDLESRSAPIWRNGNQQVNKKPFDDILCHIIVTEFSPAV